MHNINFKNDILILNNKQLYRSIYYSTLRLSIESISLSYANGIYSLKDYEIVYDKASRIANIGSVKTINNKDFRNRFLQSLKDANFMNNLYNAENLSYDVEELGSNKYVVAVTMIEDAYEHEVERFEIYAPNYETALKRAKLFMLPNTPKEL